jgi:dienelactone hydrolase
MACSPNPFRFLGDGLDRRALQDGWIAGPTAVLVIHGIGGQQPLETVDQFARSLAETYRDLGVRLALSHRVARRRARDGERWFDSFVSLRREDSPHELDIHEYYWANQTEDRATAADIQKWVAGTARGAAKFYRDQGALGQANCDRSPFFRKSDGAFLTWRYRIALSLVARVVPSVLRLVAGLLLLATRLPLAGAFLESWLQGVKGIVDERLINVIGDVVVYNTTDAKSRFYAIRKRILEGAVDALRYLVEPVTEGSPGSASWRYDRVVLVGHSLGSQIAFDALNRLNQLVALGEVQGFDRQGFVIDGPAELTARRPTRITEVLGGLVTFGSPLDKMAFFLRDRVEEDQYLRRQMLDGLHGFKQRDWSPSGHVPFELEPLYPRLLEEMPWLNYFDRRDYVSGALDYYHKVTNVDCRFGAGPFAFTHSRYWRCRTMYQELIRELLHREPARPALPSRPTLPLEFATPSVSSSPAPAA